MSKAKKIFIAIFILALVVLYLIIYAIPGAKGVLTKTVVLEYGTLQVTDSVDCFIIRDEKVFSAANGGNINYFIEDGVQVRKDSQILEVSGQSPQRTEGEESQYKNIISKLGSAAIETHSYLSEANGIVSYYIDGYENYFTPDTMKTLKYSDVVDKEIVPVNVVRNATFPGEPLYKICDNSDWYLACWVMSGNVSKYEIDKKVTVIFPSAQITATITDIIDNGDMWLILLNTSRYYEDFGKVRKTKATIVTSDYSGIIIGNRSIATRDGEIGVFVKSKNGEFVFTPVQIITTDGEDSLAAVSYFYDDDGQKVKTVEIYDEILRTP